jgi:signal transduction histidine kinase
MLKLAPVDLRLAILSEGGRYMAIGARPIGGLADDRGLAAKSISGELTASIAHEVLQPLAAVNANVDAGLPWFAGGQPNLDRARAYLERIARDSKQAREVITRVRALVKKSPPTKA